MNEQPQHPSDDAAASEPVSKPEVDRGRRRLGTLGLSGTAVALSVTSRSAVAGWGTCTGSELASGNLSRGTDLNPCGCSPGYWWNPNGTRVWATSPTLNIPYPQTKKFNRVFGVNFYTERDTRLQDVGPSTNRANFCGANPNTGMHAVAALLNAQYYGARYPAVGLTTAAAVIQAFKDACNTGGGNQAKQAALVAFVSRVDVYVASNTWCQGDPHRNP